MKTLNISCYRSITDPIRVYRVSLVHSYFKRNCKKSLHPHIHYFNCKNSLHIHIHYFCVCSFPDPLGVKLCNPWGKLLIKFRSYSGFSTRKVYRGKEFQLIIIIKIKLQLFQCRLLCFSFKENANDWCS